MIRILDISKILLTFEVLFFFFFLYVSYLLGVAPVEEILVQKNPIETVKLACESTTKTV